VLLDKKGSKLLQQEACKGAETDSQEKICYGKCSQGTQEAKRVPYYGAQAQDVLHTQVIRYAHPLLRLKQQQLTPGD
jgi:hypothetical protein